MPQNCAWCSGLCVGEASPPHGVCSMGLGAAPAGLAATVFLPMAFSHFRSNSLAVPARHISRTAIVVKWPLILRWWVGTAKSGSFMDTYICACSSCAMKSTRVRIAVAQKGRTVVRWNRPAHTPHCEESMSLVLCVHSPCAPSRSWWC